MDFCDEYRNDGWKDGLPSWMVVDEAEKIDAVISVLVTEIHASTFDQSAQALNGYLPAFSFAMLFFSASMIETTFDGVSGSGSALVFAATGFFFFFFAAMIFFNRS